MAVKKIIPLLILFLSFSTFSRKVEDLDISDADRAQSVAINEEFSKMELERLCSAQEFEEDGVTAKVDDISRICAGGEMEVMELHSKKLEV